MLKIGLLGGAGYTAGELIRILTHHPKASISFIHSNSHPNEPIYKVHKDLIGETNLTFTDHFDPKIDLLFLCTGHGKSREVLDSFPVEDSTKIIDLSNDFRLQGSHNFNHRDFIYGLPELNKELIQPAYNVANPGCFATAIQLGLLPLAKNQNLIADQDIHIHAITGSTGAGQKLTPTSHFSWRNNNISTYKVFSHQHLDEINQSIKGFQKNYGGKILLTPVRGGFSRGIFATMYTESTLGLKEALEVYTEHYQTHPFVTISEAPIDLKQVVGSNKCIIHIERYENKLFITSAIDNLLKGASGTAAQNMNLMFGLEETMGLNLKSIGF